MKFVQAKHHGPKRGRPTVVVLHSMEAPEKGDTAEKVAAYFARGERVASVHYNVDNNSVVQSVADDVVAYGAAGANSFGLHIEHAGYARQTLEEWCDPYGQHMLLISADLVARKCTVHGIQVRYLNAEALKKGVRSGITTHASVSTAFGRSNHWDPGPNFPLEDYLKLVRGCQQLQAKAHSGPQPPPVRGKVNLRAIAQGITAAKRQVLRRGSRGQAVVWLQTGINQVSPNRGLAVDGDFGPATDRAVRDLQRWFRIGVDGIVGPQTWSLLFVGIG